MNWIELDRVRNDLALAKYRNGDFSQCLEALNTTRAANAPKGAVYPAGSVVQLVPTKVMVKREASFSPPTGDWEFFELSVDEKGSKIGKRGFAEMNYHFGKKLFCMPRTRPRAMGLYLRDWPQLQRSDPRCGAAQPEEGDTVALKSYAPWSSLARPLDRPWVGSRVCSRYVLQ